MFLKIFGFYIQGLLLAVFFVLLVGLCWILWRARQHKDKTVRERQAFLYEVLMMALVTAPILSFAFMAIIMMLKS